MTALIDGLDGVVQRRRVYLDDLDGYGMLHHAAYPLLFDHAVIDFWAEAGWRLDATSSVLVIRELTMTYHAPITTVGDVDVHFWISRAGRTSVTYAFRILSTDGAVVHADGTRTVVNLDPMSLRPAVFTDEMWQIAAPLLGEGVTRS
ncbi:hotdog domain-containing protein [Nocardioides sp. CER19]|uniref:acyl-CoA thioesterase n=1 Tax=Nocardioides sp. CER19 TaxID=3038538 RepID=UPI00244BA75E|nr:hotdog domain-containing protein [Nocardioides sp. CER19]MDH2414978.1 hotdog domain-containing protein [Nocardioides sp. CER19]